MIYLLLFNFTKPNKASTVSLLSKYRRTPDTDFQYQKILFLLLG